MGRWQDAAGTAPAPAASTPTSAASRQALQERKHAPNGGTGKWALNALVPLPSTRRIKRKLGGRIKTRLQDFPPLQSPAPLPVQQASQASGSRALNTPTSPLLRFAGQSQNTNRLLFFRFYRSVHVFLCESAISPLPSPLVIGFSSTTSMQFLHQMFSVGRF